MTDVAYMFVSLNATVITSAVLMIFSAQTPLSGHEEALSRFTLKKLLLLVCFLDKAKESRLIEHDPCLFCMDAEFKVGA